MDIIDHLQSFPLELFDFRRQYFLSLYLKALSFRVQRMFTFIISFVSTTYYCEIRKIRIISFYSLYLRQRVAVNMTMFGGGHVRREEIIW